MRAAIIFGQDTMIIASSGNASASAASYAARIGKKLIAVIPETTPESKVAQAAAHGAAVVKVRGAYSDSYRLCRETAERYGWFDITTTFVNPYAREGYKTIGYEIYENLRRVPDWIILPVGDGPILAAVGRAFSELKSMGVTDVLPRLACIQAENCSPIANAFIDNRERISRCEPKPTIASGINDPLTGYEEDGEYTLRCIRDSGGAAVALSETEIEESVVSLACEGIYAEPAGAAGLMGTRKLLREGVIKKDNVTVILVTGHGLKNPLPVKSRSIPVISSPEELLSFVRAGTESAK